MDVRFIVSVGRAVVLAAPRMGRKSLVGGAGVNNCPSNLLAP